MFQVRTHFARPNWKEVFTRIASKHPNSTVGNILPPMYSFFFSAHWKAWKKLLSIDQVFVILIMRVYYACRGILLWETYTCQRTEETVTWHEPQNGNPLWFPQGVLLMEKRISPDFFSTRRYRKKIHKFCIEANWSSSQYVNVHSIKQRVVRNNFC